MCVNITPVDHRITEASDLVWRSREAHIFVNLKFLAVAARKNFG